MADDAGGQTADTGQSEPDPAKLDTVTMPADDRSLSLDDGSAKRQFCIYLAESFVANAAVSGLAILLWSTVGFARETFEILDDYYIYSERVAFVCFLVLVLLYLLDFFWPPHLPGQILTLWKGDWLVGRSLLGLSGVFMIVALLLKAKIFPSIPVLVTIVFSPLGVFLVRIRRPTDAMGTASMRKTDIVNHGDMDTKMRLLKSITGEERNTLMFFQAIAATFMLTFVALLALWLLWAVWAEKGLEKLSDNLSSADRDRLYVQWATPLVVSIANFVFGCYAILRVYMQSAYSRTDVHKNRIIAELMETSMIREMTEHRLELIKKARATQIFQMESGDELQKKKEQYLQQHASQARSLSTVIKVVGCIMFLIIGLLSVANQLLYADSHIATLVLGALGLFFVVFLIFSYVAFRRIVQAMGDWLKQLPAFKTLVSITDHEVFIAFVFWPVSVLFPFVLLLSYVNQLVRKCRGLYDRYDMAVPVTQGRDDGEDGAQPEPLDPCRLLLTPRIHARLIVMKSWNWVGLITKGYVLCFIYFCYNLVPPLLNVALAYLNKALDSAGLHIGIIVLLTLLIGVVAFLLPPVPGMTIYIFGGLVISGNCPPKGPDTDQGFWTGVIVNIAACWLLKLISCAIQQELIGGLLGRSLWVRQTACVHQVGIRCVESVLRQKGFTIGKIAILCGGPDWPTSVLAGILRLSLLEMELGTLPIIFFIIPCALSGSLYLKKGESNMWSNFASMMVVFSVMVSLFLWAIAAWAMQQELEHKHYELTRPLPQNVDLEWLDYRSREMIKKVKVGFMDINCGVRWIFVAGAIIQVLVCHALTWIYSALIGTFQVSTDIDTLVMFDKWDPTKGLFTLPAFAVIVVYAASWLCYVQYRIWRRVQLGKAVNAVLAELDTQEATWKEEYLKRCEREAIRHKDGEDGEQQSANYGVSVYV